MIMQPGWGKPVKSLGEPLTSWVLIIICKVFESTVCLLQFPGADGKVVHGDMGGTGCCLWHHIASKKNGTDIGSSKYWWKLCDKTVEFSESHRPNLYVGNRKWDSKCSPRPFDQKSAGVSIPTTLFLCAHRSTVEWIWGLILPSALFFQPEIALGSRYLLCQGYLCVHSIPDRVHTISPECLSPNLNQAHVCFEI